MITKEDILNYITHTPENSNRNVLNSMLDSFYDQRIIIKGYYGYEPIGDGNYYIVVTKEIDK